MENLVKEENEKILIPRRSPEERQKNYNVVIQKKIQQYIKDGSKGDLDLWDTPITSLPGGLKVGGSLYLRGSKITSLPVGLKIGGSLDLRYSEITSLPKDLEVGGYLDLDGSKITSLPRDLKVGATLFISRTPLSKTHTEDQIRSMCPGIKGKINI